MRDVWERDGGGDFVMGVGTLAMIGVVLFVLFALSLWMALRK